MWWRKAKWIETRFIHFNAEKQVYRFIYTERDHIYFVAFEPGDIRPDNFFGLVNWIGQDGYSYQGSYHDGNLGEVFVFQRERSK